MKRARKGRPRIEDRANTIEARKPWLKLGMSRRTWYRRQAEKRQGQELQKTFVVAAHSETLLAPTQRARQAGR
jgi:hypothetical protein